MREEDIVLLNGSDEEVADMRRNMEHRRELARLAKVRKAVQTYTALFALCAKSPSQEM